MESTKADQSDSDGESEEEEADEEVVGSDGELAEGSETAEVEEEDEDVGSSGRASEHEDEEPGGSAKSRWAGSEEQTDKPTEARSRERPSSVSPSPVEQLASKVESALSVKGKEMRDKAATEVHKRRAREKQKHHSRRGAERIGRAKGSKAKQDNRVKLDKGGLWD